MIRKGAPPNVTPANSEASRSRVRTYAAAYAQMPFNTMATMIDTLYAVTGCAEGNTAAANKAGSGTSVCRSRLVPNGAKISEVHRDARSAAVAVLAHQKSQTNARLSPAPMPMTPEVSRLTSG